MVIYDCITLRENKSISTKRATSVIVKDDTIRINKPA